MKYALLLLVIFLSAYLLVQKKEEGNNGITIGKTISLHSKVLNEDRDIHIYEPPGFWGMDEEVENLPVTIVLDGESQFLQTVSTIDFLSAAPNGNDRMPRSIIVGIPNTERNRDFTPIKGSIVPNDTTFVSATSITGGGPAFLEFITTELIPYIDETYSTCNHRTLIGHSLGGLLTFEALLRKRAFFTNYLIIDPALSFADEAYLEEVMDTLQTADLSEEHLFFAIAGTLPSFIKNANLLEDRSNILSLNRANRKFLNADSTYKRINLNCVSYPDDSHFSIPLSATHDAMAFFYDYYSFDAMMDYYHPGFQNRDDLIPRMVEHYQYISHKMGCDIIPMQGYINSFAFGISEFEREDLAIELFQYNINAHPNSPIVYNNLGYYYMQNGNREKAIESFKASLKLANDENILENVKQLERELKSER